MINLLRTNSSDPHFIDLVKKLDADLAEKDGNEHTFYAQFNKIDSIKCVVVAYKNEQPIACGAIKEFLPKIMEIKRMFTLPEYRGKGIGALILEELEKWGAELSCENLVLETGKKQPAAIALYKKNGYTSIPNYGQYEGIENSLCFGKKIK